MQIILRSQLERVETGKNPTTGVIEVYAGGIYQGEPKTPAKATHFLSHRDQLNSIHRAQLIFRQHSFFQSKKLIDMGKTIGEGYKRDGLQYGKKNQSRGNP